MNELSKLFKELSTKERIRFICTFPFLIMAALNETIAEVITDIIDIIYPRIKNRWKSILIYSATLLALVLIIFGTTYIDETVPDFRGSTKADAEYYVYKNCHEMTNRYIVAEDGRRRGYVRADDKNIDKIVDVAVRYSLDDNILLINWLNEFSMENYSNAVIFHNYCWVQLDGEVGFAEKLRREYR